MEHLVESHCGGHYISSMDPEFIEQYCEQCGDSDRILISWEEGDIVETLSSYFSEVKRDRNDIEEHHSLEVDKDEIFSLIMSEHQDDWYLIKELYEDKALTLEEKKQLLDICYATMKKQVEIVLDVYEKGKPRTRHPKKNNKKQNN